MGRPVVIVAVLCGIASAKPVWRPPTPRTDPLELVARLEDAIRHRDVTAVQAMLADPMMHDGLWFADAACTKRFGTKGTIEKADVRVLAKCLAQQKLIATTRRSSLPGGAILTFDRGIELELVFKNDRVTYAAGLWPRDADRGLPTLTVQTFEALRTAGTTQLDAVLAGKLSGTASAWIKICLDKTGAIASTFVARATPIAARDAFLAAIGDWKFEPFRVRKTPTAACSLSLLTYPAASAPAIEVLPPPPVPVPVGRISLDDALVDIYDFNGMPRSTPRNVPPSLLEQNRIRGTRQIDPDSTTKAAIVKSGRASVVASLELCIDTKGKVSSVKSLKSSGFPDYDVKLERAIRRWAYRPYLVRSIPAAVCTAVTFIYRAKP